jgi:hypothetical protein
MPITWYCQDANSADVTAGTSFNKTLNEAIPSPANHAKTNVGGGTTDEVTHTYSGIANVPNLTSWDAGNYIAKINCSVLGADCTFKIAVCRINSAGALVSTLGTSSSFNTTGYKSFTHNLASPLSVNAGDRLQIRVLTSRAASMGNQTITTTVGTVGSLSCLDTPITLRRGPLFVS